MKKLSIRTVIVCLSISVSLLCPALNATGQEKEKKEAETKMEEAKGDKKDSLMERIDFGNSYILGQSIKSGAVYLLHRKKSGIKSMLKTREDYREEILEEFKVNKTDKVDEDSGSFKPGPAPTIK